MEMDWDFCRDRRRSAVFAVPGSAHVEIHPAVAFAVAVAAVKVAQVAVRVVVD